MNKTRGRAWRRAIKRRKKSKDMTYNIHCKYPKKWRLLYGRSAKISRAKQLGFSYPRQYLHQLEFDIDD